MPQQLLPCMTLSYSYTVRLASSLCLKRTFKMCFLTVKVTSMQLLLLPTLMPMSSRFYSIQKWQIFLKGGRKNKVGAQKGARPKMKHKKHYIFQCINRLGSVPIIAPIKSITYHQHQQLSLARVSNSCRNSP